MHEAYEATSVLDRLPYQIECIGAYGDHLIVGTKNGFALVYIVKSQGGSSFHVSLEQANKSFARKAVTQIEAIPELDILISLSDNTITVHELRSLKPLTAATQSLSLTKGANVFSVDVEVLRTIDGSSRTSLKLCVSVRKKLQTYYWKKEGFKEFKPELSLPDIPKVVSWCKESICVGFKRDYYLVEIDSGDLKELFPTGRNLDPIIARINTDKLALNKDNMTILIDHTGLPTQTHGIMWSESPLATIYRPPYLISVLPKLVEVRTIEPRLLIQNIELDRPRILTHTRDGVFYVGSATGVWRLVFLPVSIQIKQLIDNKEFELALLLSETENIDNPESETEKRKHLSGIKNLHAFELFSQRRYEESLKILSDLQTDPSHVIGLYPDLLPKEFRDRIRYPRQLNDMGGSDREKALLSLIDYLSVKRAELSKLEKEVKTVTITPLMEGSDTVKTRKQLCQIIDTTLLKCYLEINDALVAPLLRLKDNNCHVEESEKALKRSDKLDELIILYETKELHKKALGMLLQQSQSRSAPETLRGVERTVDYLQRLNKKHVDIILEYAAWVIRSDPEKGLSIFTDELLDKKQRLPVDKVLDFLQKQPDGNKLVISYLRHVIYEWKEENSDYHDKLICAYQERITPLLTEYINSLPEGQMPVAAGNESGDLGDLRKQLLSLLNTSQHYKAEKLLKSFPYEYYHEERAILHGRAGHHKQALFIYVILLQNQEMAESYCKEKYNAETKNDCDVYVHLLNYYLRPLDSVSDVRMLYGPQYSGVLEPNTESALRILRLHCSKLDSKKVLDILPDNFLLIDILPYLENTIGKGETQKRHQRIIRNLLYSEKLITERSRIAHERTKFTVTERSQCFVCHNKISTSSFARYTDKRLAHLGCLSRNELDGT